MENINAVVVGSGIAMVIAIIIFIKIYDANKKKSDETLDADVFEKRPVEDESPVHDPGIPGIIPATPTVVTEEFDESCDKDCGCKNECNEEAEEAVTVAPVLIKINSISRIKEKSRKFLMDSDANYTRKGADAILNDLNKSFPAEGLDLTKAPFEYTIQ